MKKSRRGYRGVCVEHALSNVRKRHPGWVISIVDSYELQAGAISRCPVKYVAGTSRVLTFLLFGVWTLWHCRRQGYCKCPKLVLSGGRVDIYIWTLCFRR